MEFFDTPHDIGGPGYSSHPLSIPMRLATYFYITYTFITVLAASWHKSYFRSSRPRSVENSQFCTGKYDPRAVGGPGYPPHPLSILMRLATYIHISYTFIAV